MLNYQTVIVELSGHRMTALSDAAQKIVDPLFGSVRGVAFQNGAHQIVNFKLEIVGEFSIFRKSQDRTNDKWKMRLLGTVSVVVLVLIVLIIVVHKFFVGLAANLG